MRPPEKEEGSHAGKQCDPQKDEMAADCHTEQSQSNPRSRSDVFEALAKDARLSHGAFRLWHVLRIYSNIKTGKCWPSQRRLQDDLHCSNSSLKPWTDELAKSRWLKIDVGQNKKGKSNGYRFVYTLLDGTGQPFPKSGTVTAPKSRNATHRSQNQERSVPKSRNGAFPKVGAEHTKEPRRGGSLVEKKQIEEALCAPDSPLDAESGASASQIPPSGRNFKSKGFRE